MFERVRPIPEWVNAESRALEGRDSPRALEDSIVSIRVVEVPAMQEPLR